MTTQKTGTTWSISCNTIHPSRWHGFSCSSNISTSHQNRKARILSTCGLTSRVRHNIYIHWYLVFSNSDEILWSCNDPTRAGHTHLPIRRESVQKTSSSWRMSMSTPARKFIDWPRRRVSASEEAEVKYKAWQPVESSNHILIDEAHVNVLSQDVQPKLTLFQSSYARHVSTIHV